MKREFKKIVTPEFRVSFANVFEPNDKGMYSLCMLIPKGADISAIKQLRNDALVSEWPDKAKRPKMIIDPIKDGDTDVMEDGTLRCEKYPEMRGHWVINASTKMKPGVVDRQVNPIMDKEDFYSGCYAIATIHAFAYKPDKNNPQKKYGIGICLNNVQKIRDGEPFGAKARPEDDFKPLEDLENDEFAGVGAGVKEDSFDEMFG